MRIERSLIALHYPRLFGTMTVTTLLGSIARALLAGSVDGPLDESSSLTTQIVTCSVISALGGFAGYWLYVLCLPQKPENKDELIPLNKLTDLNVRPRVDEA